MSGHVDLHLHSSASDGGLSPTLLVEAAKSIGLAAAAVTDHDTVDGLREALDAGARLSFEVVPGVELSTEWQGQIVHILGYDFDIDHPALADRLRWARKVRDDRNRQLVARLNELGIDISLADAEKKAGGRVIGRPHFAAALVDKGASPNFKQAFATYLDFGGLAYVPKERFDPADAIRLIRDAGGVAVLAHPGVYDWSPGETDSTVEELAKLGLEGIEVVYPDHSPDQVQIFLDIALRRGLLPTGGSDFHGAIKPKVRIGQGSGSIRTPYSWLTAVRARAASRRGAES